MSSARVFIRADDTHRFLFVTRAPHDVNHAGEEVPPGGKRKPGETAEHTITRETKAETGLTLENLVPLCIGTMRAKRAHDSTPTEFAVHYFLADVAHECGVAMEPGTSVNWRTLGEYLTRPSQPEYQETARKYREALER